MFETYRTRIYSIPDVIDELARYCDSGFIISGQGIWKGKREDAAVMEMVCEDTELDRIISRAVTIAANLREDSILATAQPVNAAIITATGERLPVIDSILETIR